MQLPRQQAYGSCWLGLNFASRNGWSHFPFGVIIEPSGAKSGFCARKRGRPHCANRRWYSLSSWSDEAVPVEVNHVVGRFRKPDLRFPRDIVDVLLELFGIREG